MRSAPFVGRVDGARRHRISIGLPIRDLAGLERTVAEVSDPTSPHYRQYLTPEQFANRFGAAPAQYQQLVDWAHAHNLDVELDPHRLITSVSAKVADIEAALHVQFMRGLRPDGSEFYAPDQEPSLDLELPVSRISNLENYVVPKKADSSGGSGLGGGIFGQDLRRAYAPCTSMTGAGQSIGVLSIGAGFLQSDITKFNTDAGFQNVPAVTTIGSGGFFNVDPEDTMDIELAIAMAPGAQVIAFRGGRADQGLADMFNHPEVKQLTSSWFDPLSADFRWLPLGLASQGQSFFEASGDGGAYNASTDSFTAGDLRVQGGITVVGGTDLTMTSRGTVYSSERTWPFSSGGVLSPSVGAGGISFPLPAYQVGLANSANQGSNVYRNLPDVSAVASNVEFVFNGNRVAGGGTSAAAPIWAGFTALLNQQAQSQYIGALGFLNPILYMTAKTPSGPSSFHDVTAGSNNGSPLSYTAVAGYDLATGLGSPSCGMFNALVNARSTGFGPGSAVFSNVLHTAYVANTPSNTLLRIASSDGVNWGPESPLSGQSSKASPTLVAFNGRLRMFYVANDSSNIIYQTTSTDGLSWTSPVSVVGHQSTARVGAAVFNGQLHLVYIANNSGNGLLHIASSDGASWGSETSIPGESSQTGPAVVGFNGKLRVFFLTNDTNNWILQTASTNGTSWTRQTAMNRHTNTTPAVAVLGSQLHMAFTANDSSFLLSDISSSDGTTWSAAHGIAGHSTKAGPTMVGFNGALRLSYQASDAGKMLLRINSSDGVNWGAESAW